MIVLNACVEVVALSFRFHQGLDADIAATAVSAQSYDHLCFSIMAQGDGMSFNTENILYRISTQVVLFEENLLR